MLLRIREILRIVIILVTIGAGELSVSNNDMPSPLVLKYVTS